ncbi:MAG: peroxidase-related enzyme [Anaerolineae bacterium]|nr:peroxidase-related enzyme [Anaerolineae bacterium]
MTKDTALVDQISDDYTVAALSPADRAMLDYAAKLTLTPHAMQEADVQALRQAGFDDRAILDIAQIVAYYAYVNRIADGLGVTLEDYWQRGDTPDA